MGENRGVLTDSGEGAGNAPSRIRAYGDIPYDGRDEKGGGGRDSRR